VKRTLLIGAAWVAATLSLHAALLLLDVYWNLLDWKPHYDLTAAGLGLWIAASLGCLVALTRLSVGKAIRYLSLALCLYLFGLGIHSLPVEEVGHDLMGREIASPFCYRLGRLVVLSIPAAFWCWQRFRGLKSRSEPRSASG